MAICNVFKELTKNNGTFFTFSQYAEDLTINQSNSSYKVVPSKFMCCDVDYSLFSNITLPALLQNNFENGCSFLRSKMNNEWTPDISKNVFWNEVGKNLFKIDDSNSNIVYVSDINIQSYTEKDSVGYNEIYCYIPNEAKQSKYNFISNETSSYHVYGNEYICGYTEKDLDFTGLLPINNIYIKDTDELSEKNLYAYKYSYTEELLLDFDNPEVVDGNKFSFNTIVVFYDVYEGDVLKYTSIPLGMYVSGIIEDGVMNNSITKFVSNDDIYSSGTSYGLRICNRFTISSNGTIIKTDSNVTGGEDLMYPALSQAMSAMVDSQAKLDQLINGINDYQQGIKDHLAKFKNYRTNVPYIKLINNVPYWFINGKNTNQKIFYDVNSTSGDNVVFADSTLSENGINIKTYHKEYHSEDINVNQLDYSVDYSGNNIFVTFPTVNIDKTGHVCGTSNKTLLIQLPESVGSDGNYKCVQTLEEMGELMSKTLIPGTLVYVEETDKIYIYKRDGFV